MGHEPSPATRATLPGGRRHARFGPPADNCLDRRLGAFQVGFDTAHVLDFRWERIGDSTLVRLAADEFDVLLTIDGSMAKQVNLVGIDLAVVVVSVPSNRLKDCLPRVAEMLEALSRAEVGQFTFI